MGSEMQNEWDLDVKAACLAYNTTVHSSTGQTPFFATFGREAIVPIHWVYPIPKPDAEMDVSAWRYIYFHFFMSELLVNLYSGIGKAAVREKKLHYTLRVAIL